MWRTEKIGLYKTCRFLNVFKIPFGTGEESSQMIVCMVSGTMPPAKNFLIEFWVSPDILSDAKESGFDAVSIERVQYPRCNLRYWTIVECQIEVAQ